MALGTAARVMANSPEKGPLEKDEDLGDDYIVGPAEPERKLDGSEVLRGRGGKKKKGGGEKKEGKGKASAGGGGGGGGGKKKKGKR